MKQLNESHPAMSCIGNFTSDELSSKLNEDGFPSYRGKQLFHALYTRNHNTTFSFDTINTLPADLRNALLDKYGSDHHSIRLKDVHVSEDGTKKMLFTLLDDTAVETVLIPSEMINEEGLPKRRTLCISTQVGCALGCAFCATATLKLKRNLATAEIVDQYTRAREICSTDITNIVFMGMGEPMLNYDNVMKAVDILTHPESALITAKHITLSTAGIVPGIIRLADESRSIKLALSLHGTTQGQREAIMPIANKYSLKELGDALEYYYRKTKKPITFEYILFDGFNDSQDDVMRLSKLTRRVPSKVNVIPFHTIEFTAPEGISASLKPAPESTFHAFIKSLRNQDVTVMIRSSSGLDIDAACGQLAYSHAGGSAGAIG
ncbi:MAG: 23S rRNA (adenine(2503)-C(2))-methyltransferase RlmN [Candidatus Kapaibacteriota bacterium]